MYRDGILTTRTAVTTRFLRAADVQSHVQYRTCIIRERQHLCFQNRRPPSLVVCRPVWTNDARQTKQHSRYPAFLQTLVTYGLLEKDQVVVCLLCASMCMLMPHSLLECMYACLVTTCVVLCQSVSRGEALRRVAAACVTGSVAWSSAVSGVSAKAPAPVMKLPDGEHASTRRHDQLVAFEQA